LACVLDGAELEYLPPTGHEEDEAERDAREKNGQAAVGNSV